MLTFEGIMQQKTSQENNMTIDNPSRDYTKKTKLSKKILRVDNSVLMESNCLAMKKIINSIHRICSIDASILILGETGTGKDVIAKYIHNNSKRSKNNFIILDCSTIARELAEDALFGHERGAFTSASTFKPGYFELADKGTLHMSEIGNMSLEVQAKLLRFLEDQTLTRLGGSTVLHFDTRIIMSTNMDLALEVKSGRFRNDLYYRISTICIELLPLRARREDIILFADFFANEFCNTNGRALRGFAPETIELMMDYWWPGNIRELKNMIQRIYYMETRNDPILPDEIAPLMEDNALVEGAFHTKIRMPRELTTALKQYLSFFNDFVRIAKGKEISFEVLFDKDGLELVSQNYNKSELEELNVYLREYLSYIKQNLDDLKIVFETDVDPITKKILVVSLQNEIQQLKFKLEIKKIEIDHLNNTVSRLFNLLENNYQNPQPFNLQLTQTTNQMQSVSVNIDLSFELSSLQDEFMQLRKVLAEKCPELDGELKEIDEHLLKVNPNAQNKSEIDVGALNRIRRFLTRINDPNSELNKTVKGVESIVNVAQKLGRTYNKIAQWVALPQIPDLFLGK